MKPDCIGRPVLAGLLALMLAGCGAGRTLSPGSASVGSAGAAEDLVAPSAAAAAVDAPASKPGAGTDESAAGAGEPAAAARSGFSTRYAHFAPVDWGQVPGWRQDALGGVGDALARSCAALGRGDAWSGLCARLGAVSGPDALRAFIEREFEPYEVGNPDRSRDGLITGYYEPFIEGRRSRQGAFVHAVHGLPADLLTLDLRQIPKAVRGAPVPVRVAGRKVVPAPEGTAPYRLDLSAVPAGVLDRRVRLRIEGDRLVAYPTRAEIVRGELRQAPVLAWVDNVAALYSMHIQGSGRVRLEDGKVLRLAFAEQNGHPFRPPQRTRTRGMTEQPSLFARGLDIDFEAVAESAGALGEGPRTRGAARPGLPSARALDRDVERLVEALAAGATLGEAAGAGSVGAAPAPVAAGSAVRPAQERPQLPAAPAAREPAPAAVSAAVAAGPGARPATGPAPRVAAPAAGAAGGAPAQVVAVERESLAAEEVMRFPQPSAETVAAIEGDPSYVFFRALADGPDGPVGALGVPLTAGRSVAVDPRTMPLGFPVFIATTLPRGNAPLNRLVLAQDTGGAIRGAVRADYFWGLGSRAFAQAAHMKERGRLWLLLPRGMPVAARDRVVRTRGAAVLPECLVEEEGVCVEDVE